MTKYILSVIKNDTTIFIATLKIGLYYLSFRNLNGSYK